MSKIVVSPDSNKFWIQFLGDTNKRKIQFSCDFFMFPNCISICLDWKFFGVECFKICEVTHSLKQQKLGYFWTNLFYCWFEKPKIAEFSAKLFLFTNLWALFVCVVVSQEEMRSFNCLVGKRGAKNGASKNGRKSSGISLYLIVSPNWMSPKWIKECFLLKNRQQRQLNVLNHQTVP